MIKRYEKVGKDYVAVSPQDRIVGILYTFPLPEYPPKVERARNDSRGSLGHIPSVMFRNFDGPDGAA